MAERVQFRHRPRLTPDRVEEMCSMTQWSHDRHARHDGGVSARALSIAFVALCVFSFTRVWAQYRSTQWTADSGLPQNSVRGIVQATDGYLWVATLDGIAKFDGIRFTVFNKSNTPGITSNRFVAMAEGDGGDLWMASEDGNLIRYHAGHFQRMGETAGLRPYSVGAITYDHRGGVWVDSDNRVYRWSPQSGRFEREAFDRDDTRFIPLWWGGTGFWAIQNGNLVCFTRGHLTTHLMPKTLTPAHIRGVAVGADDVVWIGTTDGHLGRLVEGSLVVGKGTVTTDWLSSKRENWKGQIAPDFRRTLIFPSDGIEKGIPYNVVVADDEDNMWAGSEDEGLFRVQRQSIKSLSSMQGLASDGVYPVMESSAGDMWVGSWPAGLSRVHDGRVTAFTKADGVPGLVTALAEDRSGNIWVGSHSGVRMFSHGRLIVPPGMPEEELPVVQVIHQMKDGAMMLGTPKGIYILAGPNSRWMTTHDGLASDDVRVILEDRSGDTWVGGYGGLTRIHNEVTTRWTEAEGLPSNNIRAIVQDTAGEIWVGTYDGGIGWLHNGRWVVFNQSSGLYDDGAFQILEDGQERFWISSNRGIYRVSRKQLIDVAEGREKRLDSVAYGRADGMLSMECNGGVWPAGAKDAHGFLWFPTEKGVAIVDPTSVSVDNLPPRVVIESASVEHKLQTAVNQVVMRPGQTNLEVQYTALNYSRPEQISFRYKLDGVDDNWQEVGHRRTAYYTHLPPGDYVFRVAARNSDGVESLVDSTLGVTVVPPFYRRWWFFGLIVLTVLAIAWLLWNRRAQQMAREHASQQAFSRELIASQENERRRIAAELHDSLGQRMIIINNLALFLLKTKGKSVTEEDKQQTIEEISSEATQAIEETRAISYALRPFQLDRLGLSKAIQAMLTKVARASEIELSANIEDIDDAFPEDLRINFYRIVQEGVNNIVKHSHATQGTVTAQRTKSSVVLTISDNGRGLPSEPRNPKSGAGGFGLTGIRERAMLMKGTLQIKSENGNGTLLVIDFPLESERVL
jgi:signal transduction histidine kinase/ligand-binding sensor domain-containing protein